MNTKNVKCPMCGAMNRNLNLDETDGWMECAVCKAVTCPMPEFESRMVKVPLLRVKWMEDNPATVG